MADDDDTPEDETQELERLFHLVPPTPERQGDPGHDSVYERIVGIELVRLRADGLTYDQIAERAGYSDRSTARQAVLRVLDRHEVENVGQLRKLENLAHDAHVAVCRAISDNDSLPPEVRLKAIDTRTRPAARHARLNGLDAPQQIAVTSITQIELAQA